MSNTLFESLEENEFTQLLLALPKDILTVPFIRSPKKFAEHIKGFRPSHLPDNKIINIYLKLAYEKKDTDLMDYINTHIKKYFDDIDLLIDEKLFQRLISLDYSNEDMAEFIRVFQENNIKINLEIYFKIHNIALSKESQNFLCEQIDKIKRTKELTMEIETKLKTKYEEILKAKDNELNECIRQTKDRMKLKYEKLLSEENEKFQRIKNSLDKEKIETENKYLEYKVKSERYELVIEDLKKKVREQEDINKNYQDIIIKSESEINRTKDKIEGLTNELIKLKSIKISDLIDKKTLDEIFNGFNSFEGKEKLKEYYEKYTMDSYEHNIENIWKRWTTNEEEIVSNFFNIVLSEQKLNNNSIEELDDLVYSLNLRCILIKLLESISYKYLSSQKYSEVFEQ